jgi:hypothetical protein
VPASYFKIFRQKIQEIQLIGLKHIKTSFRSDSSTIWEKGTGISKDELAENKILAEANLHIYTTIPIFGFAIHDWYWSASGCNG